MKLVISNLKLVSSFQPLLALKPTTSFLHDIFAADLDGDGIQEFLIAGRQQNESRANWSNSAVHIFHSTAAGWEDVTAKWLPDNVIVGSEPSEDCRAHYYRYIRSTFRPFAACNL